MLKRAIALATSLTSSAASATEINLAESFFADVQRAYPDDVTLLLAMSGVRYIEGDLEAVIALSKRILTIDPQNVLALNNLSSLLAEQPAHQAEAAELINRALEEGGRTPTLLDTKAMIEFHQGQTEVAAQLLSEAVAKPVKDAADSIPLCGCLSALTGPGAGSRKPVAGALGWSEACAAHAFRATTTERT